MGSHSALRLAHTSEPQHFDVILMDCDGVIFDVNDAKVRAFADSLAGHPAHLVGRFLEHHKAHGGVSRYAKFRWFFNEVVAVDDAEANIDDALARYGAASRAAYTTDRLRDDALQFIREMEPAPVYVVSGSDQSELREVFRAHGLQDQVAAVLGSPRTKLEHCTDVLEDLQIEADRALIVGDGRAELEVAVSLGAPFVFLAEMTDWAAARHTVLAYDQATLVPTWTELLGRVVRGAPRS